LMSRVMAVRQPYFSLNPTHNFRAKTNLDII
jgi:hypothetical protein